MGTSILTHTQLQKINRFPSINLHTSQTKHTISRSEMKQNTAGKERLKNFNTDPMSVASEFVATKTMNLSPTSSSMGRDRDHLRVDGSDSRGGEEGCIEPVD